MDKINNCLKGAEIPFTIAINAIPEAEQVSVVVCNGDFPGKDKNTSIGNGLRIHEFIRTMNKHISNGEPKYVLVEKCDAKNGKHDIYHIGKQLTIGKQQTVGYVIQFTNNSGGISYYAGFEYCIETTTSVNKAKLFNSIEEAEKVLEQDQWEGTIKMSDGTVYPPRNVHSTANLNRFNKSGFVDVDVIEVKLAPVKHLRRFIGKIDSKD